MGTGVQFRDALVNIDGVKNWLEIKSWKVFSDDAFDRLRKQAKSHFERISEFGTNVDFKTPLRYEFDGSVIGNVTKQDIITELKDGLKEVYKQFKNSKELDSSFDAWFKKAIEVDIV